MEIVDLLMNKPFCLGLSILGISKIVMDEFCFDYVKPKYRETQNHSSHKNRYLHRPCKRC